MEYYTENFLEHYGIRGMHWGIRKGKSKASISRVRGATIDRHNRAIGRVAVAQAGNSHKNLARIGRAFAGKQAQQENWNQTIKNLKQSNARIKSGKLSLMDKLDVYGNTSIGGLFISRTPTTQANAKYTGANQTGPSKYSVKRDPKTGARPIAVTLDKSKFGELSKRNVDRYNAKKYG